MLDDLAHRFADHNFDLKFLIRAIVSTRAYQLTSRQTDPSQDDPRLFARMAVKALSTEQVIASLIEATGYQPPAGARPAARPAADGTGRQLRPPAEQAHRVPDVDSAGAGADERQVRQRRHRPGAERHPGGRRRRAVPGHARAASKRCTWRRWAASRRRRRAAKLVAYVEKGGPSGDPGLALADVFWALLNSSEFVFNH